MRGKGRDRIEEKGRRWRERERESRERERVLSPFQRRLNGPLALVVVLWVVVASMAVARKAIAAAREALTVEL